jgi:ribulose 1,5-bisphosphate synthetase/thiazole synthase
MKRRLKSVLYLTPGMIYINNRVDKGKNDAQLPPERHIVVVGGGISGIVTSYYLTMDKRTKVTLLEKNKQIMTEASGHDSGLLLTNNITLRTFGSQPMGKIKSLTRVDGPNCVYTTHMAMEPGLIKFTWHWLL